MENVPSASNEAVQHSVHGTGKKICT